MRVVVILAALGALVSAATPIGAAPPGGPPEVVPGQSSATEVPAAGSLDLAIRAQALGLTPATVGDPTLGLGTMRAPTGAGTTRWPSAEVAPGLYMGAPTCLPGEDSFSLRRPPSRRR